MQGEVAESGNEKNHPTPVEQLARAVYDKGRMPIYHDTVMARHRKEWPTLWAAIDRLLESRGG